MTRRRSLSSSSRLAIVNGILGLVALIVILQLWLFTATVNAHLGGDDAMVLPGLLVSLVCLALNGGLLVYLYRLDR